MGDNWIEPRSRVPLAGIVAMVVIVAVVAIFVKTQLGPLFPASDVKIETATSNTAGRASASFYGMREVQLKPVEYLQGVLSKSERSIGIVVEPSSKLLIITEGSRREEVQLHEDGNKLSATFEYNTVLTSIAVDTAGRYLIYTEPDKSAMPIQVPLSDGRRYQGFFTVRNRQYLFQFSPAGTYAMIVGSRTDRVELSNQNDQYVGVWDEAGKKHPVSVDTENMVATIEDVY